MDCKYRLASPWSSRPAVQPSARPPVRPSVHLPPGALDVKVLHYCGTAARHTNYNKKQRMHAHAHDPRPRPRPLAYSSSRARSRVVAAAEHQRPNQRNMTETSVCVHVRDVRRVHARRGATDSRTASYLHLTLRCSPAHSVLLKRETAAVDTFRAQQQTGSVTWHCATN